MSLDHISKLNKLKEQNYKQFLWSRVKNNCNRVKKKTALKNKNKIIKLN